MNKTLLFFIISITFAAQLLAQSGPGMVKHKGEKLLVYPFRITDETEVPVPGYKIPDGKYAVLYEYRFKKKLFRKKLKLRDSTIVAAVITIKDNQPDGSAVFYSYDETASGKLRSRPMHVTYAFFKNGLKEGAWTCRYRSGSSEVTHYKEGLQNGYFLSYSSKNILLLKQKFLDETMVDTVYSYRYDGSPEYSYDLLNGGYTQDYTNVYAYLADKKNLVPYDIEPEKIKSFFRTYDKKGAVQNDLHFKNGNLLEFKTIIDPFDGSVFELKKVKPEEPDSVATFILTGRWSNVKNLWNTNTYFYRNFELEKEINVRYYSKSKTADTTVHEYYQVSPELKKSKKPILVVAITSRNYSKKTWYIPYYKFNYTEGDYLFYAAKSYKPAFIDTLRDLIYINDTSSYSQNFKAVKYKLLFDEDHHIAFESAIRPYKANKYLLGNGYRTGIHEESNYTSYNQYSESIYRNKSYKESVMATSILKDGKPFTGKVFFSPDAAKYIKKNDTWRLPYSIKNYQVSRGEIVNGKYSGNWQMTSSALKVKLAEKDLFVYFTAHQKDNTCFSSVNYSNGLKNGTYVSYQCDKTGDLWYMTEGKTKKEMRKLITYKEEESNYTNDTLHGSYRTWYANGKPKEEFNYAMGSPDGKFTTYTPIGQVEYMMTFTKGKLEGEYIYNQAGKLNVKATFVNNHLTGSLTYYLRTGEPYLEITAKNDTVQSKKLFFPNKSLKEQILLRPGSELLMDQRLISSDSYLESTDKTLDDFNFMADYTNYYEDGKVLSKGLLNDGFPSGKWLFYNTNNTVINEVVFEDTSIVLPGTTDTVDIIGYLTGYYHNGKIRVKGYLRNYVAGYDCSLHQDMTTFDYYISDYWTIEGKQTCGNGKGESVIYNEGAQRIAEGKVNNYKEEGLWKYYDPDQKLKEVGKYVNGSKEGIWYEGDLEGINFEDNACFDQNDSLAMKELAYSKKVLHFGKKIYRNNHLEKSENFNTDQNKERDYDEYSGRRWRGRRGDVIVDF